jgi:hypothetical protein
MEGKQNDLLIKNNYLKKLNLEAKSNNFSLRISKSLWYILFLKIIIFLYLFIKLIKIR